MGSQANPHRSNRLACLLSTAALSARSLRDLVLDISTSIKGSGSQHPVVSAGLARRLACFLYEGVLLFGVLMAAGFAYSTLTQQRHALTGTTGMQVVVFLTLGMYFVGFWTRGGQTLAMQTWQIRLVTAQGERVKFWRATFRYLLSWLWFVPALAIVSLSGLKGGGPTFAALLAGCAGVFTAHAFATRPAILA